MPPTIRDGQVVTKGTSQVNQDRHVVDMLPKIYTYDPASTPMLTVLTNRARVRPAGSYEVKHLEDEPIPEWDTENGGGATNVATTITVSNGGYHRASDIILNPATGEYLRVTAVSTNTLTVTRGYNGTAAAIAAGQRLLNLGAPEREGSSAPVAKATVTVTKSNFTQIKRTPVHLSRTLSQVSLYGGDERPRLRRKAGAEHARDWEQVLLHSRKKEDTATAASAIRMAGGLDEHIVTNVLAVNGVLSESDFLDFAGDTFRYKVDGGGGAKALLAGRALLNTLANWGASKLVTDPTKNGKYGFAVQTYITPYGMLDVVYHPLLEEAYEGFGYIVDMAGIWIRPLQRTILKTEIQDNDEDGMKDEYLTEQSYSFINERAFGKVTGVTF